MTAMSEEEFERLLNEAQGTAGKANGHYDAIDIKVWDAGDDPGPIPPRGWLLGNHFCKGYISSVVAAGGTGKSALRLLQFISMATGRSLSGQHVFKRSRVLLISLEDDTWELHRRIKAVLLHYDIPRSELAGWLYCSTPKKIKLAMMKDRDRVAGPLAVFIRGEVERLAPDILALDPFVKLHALKENDSGDMDFVCDMLAEIGCEYDIAIDSPHHVHKGQVTPGDADSGRGSSGIRDAARLVYTLARMSPEDTQSLGVTEIELSHLIRLDMAKANTAPPADKAELFKLVSVNIGNATPEYPSGDSIQVVEPWTPPDVWAGMTTMGINTILTEINQGILDADGNPNGRRYSNAPGAKDRAVWPVIKRHYQDKIEPQCRKIIHVWLDNKLLYSKDYNDPVDRKPVKGLYVDDDKRPS